MAVPTTLLIIGAIAVWGSAGRVVSLLPSTASAASAPKIPLRHGGSYPGAAALAGDAPTPSGVNPVPTLAKAPTDVPPYWRRCHAPSRQSSVLECVLGDTSRKPGKVIALVGDSATGAFMVPLDVIGKARHWKIVTMLHSLCTWTATATLLAATPKPNLACRNWGAAAEDRLVSLKPDVVISTDRPRVRTPAAPAIGPASATDVGRGLATYWRRLLDHEIPVVAIRETPEPGRNMPNCLATRSIASCSTVRASALPSITPVTVAERAVGGRAFTVDLNDLICSTVCAPVVGNVVVYRDVHHLTQTFGLTLAPYLERRLLRVPALADG